MDSNYKCTLSNECLKTAKEELNENPIDRLSSVKKLREWVEEQSHLICRTDTHFLLKFLRTAKFSQLRAREIIEGYLTLRNDQPYFLHNWNPHENYVKAFLRSGLFLPLPGYLKGGIKVILFRFEHFTTANPGVPLKEYKDAIHKAFHMVLYHVMRDENAQVSGIVYIMDWSNTTVKTATVFSPLEAKDIMRFQNNVAGRFKGFWFYNESAVMNAAFNMFRPFMKKKMLDRIRFYGTNLERLYNDIPMSMLPEEYLPDDYTGPNAGTFQSLADDLWKDISQKESIQELQHESDPKWRIDKKKSSEMTPSASFRKLTVD